MKPVWVNGIKIAKLRKIIFLDAVGDEDFYVKKHIFPTGVGDKTGWGTRFWRRADPI